MQAATSQSLAIRGLYKHYGKHSVLNGINLDVTAGSIHGLVGLNGAGKTTTLSCLLGLIPYDGGEVSVLGYQPRQLYLSQGKVAVVFDEPCLHPSLAVGQALQFARLTLGKPSIGNKATGKSLDDIEKLLGIERYHDFKVRQLSLGNRRRTAIAQALVGNPQLMILDEPFNGLDAGGVDDVLSLIQQLNQQQGITFLLASHQLYYLERICTHMAILHRGQIAVSDSITTLLRKKHSHVTLQTSNNSQALSILRQLDGIKILSVDAEHDIACELDAMSSAALNRYLVQSGIDVHELVLHRPSLDSLFRQYTANEPLIEATNTPTAVSA
jgi:ABC-type multidrug transport system ATPase subunit